MAYRGLMMVLSQAAKAGRGALAERFGRDGREPLTAIFAQRSRPWLRELPQVAQLCTVLRHNYLIETGRDGSELRRRTEEDGVPPAPLRLISPHDPDAQWVAKGKDVFWLGYSGDHLGTTRRARS